MSELVVHTEMSRDAEIVMTVIGAIDAASAHRVVEACRREPTGIDVIDLRFVSLFSAAGVTALLTVRETHPLRLVTSTAVQQVLEATELADEFRASEPTGPPHLHQAPFGFAVHDADLRFRYVNDALAAINGLAAQAHYGCRPDELFDVHHDEVSPILRSVLDTGIDQTVHVAGDTVAASGGLWRCGYRRARYALPPTGRIETVVISTVDQPGSTPPPSATPRRTSLIFDRR